MFVCIYIYIYTYIHVLVLNVYTHTHTHTHTRALIHIVRVEKEFHSFLTLALHGGVWSSSPYIYQGLFYAAWFTPFGFNASCQYTPLLTLCPLIFGFTHFDWFISIITNIFFLARMLILIYAFIIYVHLFMNTSFDFNSPALSVISTGVCEHVRLNNQFHASF